MKKTTMILMALALSASVVMAQDNRPPRTPTEAATTTSARPPADPVIITAGDVADHASRSSRAAVKTLPAEYQQFAMGPGKKQFAEDYPAHEAARRAGA